jgi:nicotinate-nucleotide adenylyltransferase
MNEPRKKIAIFGGAFNPPQIGHAMAMEAIVRLFLCDEIWVMPSKDRGDKKISASDENRLSMLTILTEELFSKVSVPIVISRFEINLPGLTRTIETKKALEREHPDYDFWFVIGSDVLPDIQTKWVSGEVLWREARFVVMPRLNNIPTNLPSNFTVLREGVCGEDISSTFVRELIEGGSSGVPYTTPGVARYIAEHGLYKS